MRHTKPTRMRTRRRVEKRVPWRTVLAATTIAAMFSAGHAEVPLGQQLGNILPQSDRALAECIYAAKCDWKALEDYAEQIVKEYGPKHKLDSSQTSNVLSRINGIKAKMDTLKATFESQKSSLSFGTLDDAKLAAKLLKCLEKNICAAQAKVDVWHKRLTPKYKEGQSPKPVKPPKAAPLKNAADAGEDLLSEALRNLVMKAKTTKKARKKAVKKTARKKATKSTYTTDFEARPKRARKKAHSKSARARAARSRSRSGDGPSAKVEKNTYLALGAQGKVVEGDAFYFETLPLELSGDVLAHVDIGLFSDSKKVHAAAGDGEQGCLEVSTVGSAPAAAFVSLCGRQNAGRGGFEAYMLTPQGARAVTFLNGVEVAEFRVSVQGGMVSFEIRDADVRGAWTVVDQVAKPADPMTISVGAAYMGTGDEVGFDNLSVESIYADD